MLVLNILIGIMVIWLFCLFVELECHRWIFCCRIDNLTARTARPQSGWITNLRKIHELMTLLQLLYWH